jgi:hypothetical protein
MERSDRESVAGLIPDVVPDDFTAHGRNRGGDGSAADFAALAYEQGDSITKCVWAVRGARVVLGDTEEEPRWGFHQDGVKATHALILDDGPQIGAIDVGHQAVSAFLTPFDPVHLKRE